MRNSDPLDFRRSRGRAGLGPLPVAWFAGLLVLVLSGIGSSEEPDLEALRARAHGGDAAAQFQLGFAYDTGLGGRADDAEAVRWYRMAAEKGLADAQYNLAVMYDSGEGVDRDPAEAARWYREAAEQGHGLAQLNLGAAYGDGQGVPRSYAQAYVWLSLAADRLEGDDREVALQNRETAASRLSTGQLAEAERIVRAWRPRTVGARE